MPRRDASRYQSTNFSLVCTDDDFQTNSWEKEHIIIVLLHGIRAELHQLNALLSCSNFTGIPQTLRAIRANTTKRRPRKAKP